MPCRMYDLRQKEIINIRDGSRYGFVCDMELDAETGRILKLIAPGPARLLGMFGREQEYRIPWDRITQIGEDIILVDLDTKKALADCDA